MPADQAHRLQLQQRLTHGCSRHIEFRDESNFINRIAGPQAAKINPGHDRVDESFSLSGHARKKGPIFPARKGQNATAFGRQAAAASRLDRNWPTPKRQEIYRLCPENIKCGQIVGGNMDELYLLRMTVWI